MVQFKEGDVVEILNTANTRLYADGRHIGQRFTLSKSDVEELNKHNGNHILTGNKYSTNFLREDLKVVQLTATPITATPKFSVGDYVTITKSTSNWAPEMDVFIGKTVKITNLVKECDNYKISFSGNTGWSWESKDGHFRHATPDEIANAGGSVRDLKKENDELLGEAILRYPSGTKYYQLDHNGKQRNDEAIISRTPNWVVPSIPSEGIDGGIIRHNDNLWSSHIDHYGALYGSFPVVNPFFEPFKTYSLSNITLLKNKPTTEDYIMQPIKISNVKQRKTLKIIL